MDFGPERDTAVFFNRVTGMNCDTSANFESNLYIAFKFVARFSKAVAQIVAASGSVYSVM
jgi:hypothetical protein